MKKIIALAFAFVLTGSLLTACRSRVPNETTHNTGSTYAPATEATHPSTHATTPSTHATMPSTAATHPSTEMTESTHASDGTNSTGSTDNSNAARRRRLPSY